MLTIESLEQRRVFSAPGSLIVDSISQSNGYDDYFYVAEPGERVTVSLSGAAGRFQPRAQLYTPSGNALGSPVVSGAKQRFTLTAGGTYWVRIRDDDGIDSGAYALGFEGVKPRSLDSVAILLGDVKLGTIAEAAPGWGPEIDEYHFTLDAAGGRLTLSLADTASGDFSPRAELYSPSGIEVKLYSQNGSLSPVATPGNKFLTEELSETGTYVVQVHDNNFTNPGSYAVAVEGLIPPSADRLTMELGQAWQGGIGTQGEIDTYTFTVPAQSLAAAGGTYVVALSLSDAAPGSSSRLWAEMYSPSARQVAAAGTDEVENGSRVLYRLTEPGTYVVQVFDQGYDGSEDYGLALEGVIPPSVDSVPILFGQPFTGSVDAMGEVDSFHFQLTPGDLDAAGGAAVLTWSLASERTVDYALRGTIYSPSGLPIGTSLSADNQRELMLTDPGTYVVQVHDDDFTQTKDTLIARGKDPAYSLLLQDTRRPRVRFVEVSDTLISDADAGSTFTVHVLFDESMNPLVAPELLFGHPSVIGGSTPTLVSSGSGTWSTSTTANDTWTRSYVVHDRNVELANITVGVTGARDTAGNIQESYLPEAEFAVDTRAPRVVALSPQDGAIQVSPTATLTLIFQELIRKGDGDLLVKRAADGSTAQSIPAASSQVSVTGSAATITLDGELERDTSYYVEVTKGMFEDLAGNGSEAISGPEAWNFTTAPLPSQAPFVADPLPDLAVLTGTAGALVELSGVFDDPDLPNDTLTISYNDAADNSNSALVVGVLNGQTLALSFVGGTGGTARLTVHATDSTGRSASDSFNVTVATPPVARDDEAATLEDQPVEIAIFANDSSERGVILPASVELVAGSGPASGILRVTASGVLYEPDANFSGADSFRYTVRDNFGFVSNEALVTIAVTEVPDYQNPRLNLDVNDSGDISPLDALILINYLNRFGSPLPPDPTPPQTAFPFLDVNGDGAVTPQDVLEIINHLNQFAHGVMSALAAGEGESPSSLEGPIPFGIAASLGGGEFRPEVEQPWDAGGSSWASESLPRDLLAEEDFTWAAVPAPARRTADEPEPTATTPEAADDLFHLLGLSVETLPG